MIGGIFKNFASEGTPPIAAEQIFSIGGVSITNSMLMGFLVAGILIASFLYMGYRVSVKPNSKFAFWLETLTDFVLSTMKSSFGSEKIARKFLPLFLALFIFILVNNLAGLLPGMGGAVYYESEGIKAALLRPFTTDLNGTLALAIISIGTVQFFAIKQRGLFKHIAHYFSVMEPWWNPINFFIGIIEIIGELIRLLTLALRLFGVIYAGEVLVHVIANLTGSWGPIALLPIILMEIFFSFIQAYLFMMLSATYLTIGIAHDEQHSNDESQPTNVSTNGDKPAAAQA